MKAQDDVGIAQTCLDKISGPNRRYIKEYKEFYSEFNEYLMPGISSFLCFMIHRNIEDRIFGAGIKERSKRGNKP